MSRGGKFYFMKNVDSDSCGAGISLRGFTRVDLNPAGWSPRYFRSDRSGSLPGPNKMAGAAAGIHANSSRHVFSRLWMAFPVQAKGL